MTSLPGDIEMEMEDRPVSGREDMIERVARAQKVALLEITGGTLQDHLFLAMANASIRAMREPTEAMVEAWTSVLSDETVSSPLDPESGYRAMIDAALSPAQRSSTNHPEGGK